MTAGERTHNVTASVRRGVVFALAGALALPAGTFGRWAAAPFVVLGLAAFATTGGPLFELAARPRDQREGRLLALATFSLGCAALALLIPVGVLSPTLFAAAALLVGVGDLGQELAALHRPVPVVTTAGFATAAFVGAMAGQFAAPAFAGAAAPPVPEAVFLAASGALLGALVRAVFAGREDPFVLAAVGLQLPLFADLVATVTPERIVVALAVTVAFGYASYVLDTASVPGMLTGVLLGIVTMVLGDYGWFVVLFSFFVVGGLATKYGYERKLERGVAEDRGGARGSGNVLGNSLAALVAVVLFAASIAGRVPLDPPLFRYAFAASVATALGDTLSSEVGGLYDRPRLVTTLEPVEPGTDGAITIQGEIAGLAGTLLVALLAYGFFPVPEAAIAVVVGGGFVGMTADSVIGATLEGGRVGNQTVNFVATATGALAGAGLALALGLALP